MLKQVGSIRRWNLLEDFGQLRRIKRGEQFLQALRLDFGQRRRRFGGRQLSQQFPGFIHLEALQTIREIRGVKIEILAKEDRIGFRHRIPGVKRRGKRSGLDKGS